MPKRKALAAPVGQGSTETRDLEPSSVMYIGHLPHGFYEKQIQGFFSQFGTVRNLKVSRNKKTGKSKHYAFVDFQSPEVAAIAAEAMNGYMLMTQKLDCQVLPAANVHQDLFKGCHRPFRTIPWRQIEEQRHNQPRTEAQQVERLARAISRDEKRRKLIAATGMDYEYKSLKLRVASAIKSPASSPEPLKVGGAAVIPTVRSDATAAKAVPEPSAVGARKASRSSERRQKTSAAHASPGASELGSDGLRTVSESVTLEARDSSKLKRKRKGEKTVVLARKSHGGASASKSAGGNKSGVKTAKKPKKV